MTDEERKLLGERIKTARKRAGYTQVELSKIAGIAQPNFSMYENGTCSTSVKVVASIAKACHVSADYLFGISDEIVSVDAGLRSGTVTVEKKNTYFILKTSEPELSAYLDKLS